MPAGAMREGRQSAHVSMAGQEQGSRRATARREERGTEGGVRINTQHDSEHRHPEKTVEAFPMGESVEVVIPGIGTCERPLCRSWPP